MTRPPLLPLAALLALWPLAGHAQVDTDRLALTQRRVERPILQIPGRSGRPDRSYFRDGVAETTYYSPTDKAEVRVEISGPRNGTGPTLSMTKPTQQGITAELAREFPGETMLVVRTPLQNAYGPLGMATSERCVYAWQWIETLHRPADAAERLFASSGERPASLRVKLCRRPGESVARLAQAVQRLSLRDPLVRGAEMPVSRSRLRAASPRPATDIQAAAPAPQVLSRPPVRAEPEPMAPAPVAPRGAPASGYAAVPLPSAAQPVGQRPFVTTIDRAPAPQPERAPVVPQPAPPPAASAPPVPVPVPAGGGESRRYITDQATGEAGSTTIVPRPARSGLANTGEPFTGSLPPEAYRGPTR
jgi:hypothetical protein